jgi:hypothetical protein
VRLIVRGERMYNEISEQYLNKIKMLAEGYIL